jgi:outer membrane usher protein
MAVDELAPEWRAGANVSYSDTALGSFGLTWAKSQARVGNSSEVVTATYSVSLGCVAYFNLSVMQSLMDERELGVYAGVTVPFGERSTASVNSSYSNGKNELTAQAQQSVPVGDGWGYRVTGSDRGRADAMGSVQTGFGRYSAEVARRDDVTGVRANATGALAWLEGDVYPTRRIDGSFGLVQVPGYADVRVYSESQLVGRTNADGNFLLTRLRPYERNLVGIDQRDLPLDAQVDVLKMNAIPYYRSATVVPFPIRPSNGAELTIVLADGQPMPVGAEVRLRGAKEVVPVAMRGVVYLTGLSAENVLDVTWKQQSCELNVPFKPGDDPVPYLGTFVCGGVTR